MVGSKGTSLKVFFNKELSHIQNTDILSLFVSAKFDTNCFESEGCGNLDFDVSLIYEDGSVSQSVHVLDYAKVRRFPGGIVDESVCLGEAAHPTFCEVKVKDQRDCEDAGGRFVQSQCFVRKKDLSTLRSVLFQELPFEIRDFKSFEKPIIVGVLLTFPDKTSQNFLLENSITLRH